MTSKRREAKPKRCFCANWVKLGSSRRQGGGEGKALARHRISKGYAMAPPSPTSSAREAALPPDKLNEKLFTPKQRFVLRTRAAFCNLFHPYSTNISSSTPTTSADKVLGITPFNEKGMSNNRKSSIKSSLTSTRNERETNFSGGPSGI